MQEVGGIWVLFGLRFSRNLVAKVRIKLMHPES